MLYRDEPIWVEPYRLLVFCAVSKGPINGKHRGLCIYICDNIRLFEKKSQINVEKVTNCDIMKT